MVELRKLLAPDVRIHKSAFGRLLIDFVAGGASVSFLADISAEKAEQFFEAVAVSVERDERLLIPAFLGRGLVGTVQVVIAMPENQPHRAEISKLLVARHARGMGVGSALMGHAERASRMAGKTLLVLDTATGSDAERLYERLGWNKAGMIPNYSLLPDGTPCGTTIFWKELG
jgi:ribosomal protein S18 acetylase RimI-like enzyme